MYPPAIQIDYRRNSRVRITDTFHTSSLIFKNGGFFSKINLIN
jgi:hypothetical protein